MKKVVKLIDIKITDQHRMDLAKILRIAPDGDVMKLTVEAIQRAYALAATPSTSTDLKELKDNLKSLDSGLKKIQNSFQKIQHTLRFMDNAHFIDDHYCIANDGDTYLLQLAASQCKDSGFEVVVDRLLSAVQDFEQESCIDPGKGKLKDYRFTNALIDLADFYVKTFPDKKLSKNKGSVFVKFAGWFLNLHSDMKSPMRHIETAIDARTSRDK